MKIELNGDDLKPLIQAVANEVVATMQADAERIGEKLAYTEQEAARLLSMQSYQLRDERRDGRIQASVGRGGRILYSKGDLLAYLRTRRWSRDG
ncbi:MAG: hypothetical protein FD138_4090 [Planctomycetota bacterium]|nr:MAG: hypothetical protein FD138_4090 [Planctomycetota bacterium]